MDKDIKMELKYCYTRGILVLQEMKDGGSFEKSKDETSSCCINLCYYSPKASLKFLVQHLLSYTNTNHSAKMLAQYSM